MAIEIFDKIEQGTEEWFRVRMGIPTTSEFSSVLAKGKGGGESITRKKYLYRLAGEILTGKPAENFSNGYTERGHLMEPEARKLYAFAHDAQPRQVGFIRNGGKGCSPDSLIGDKGMLEIKTKKPEILIEVLFSGEIPSEHAPQLQGALWVADREWIDFVAYYTGMPLFVKRVYRDEIYIAKLAKAVAEFNEELDEIVASLRAMVAA